MTPDLIIARCTRNGVTSWQNVARQMGCSVDSVRQQFDPHYLNIRPWPHPCEPLQKQQDVIDLNDTRSPHEKPIPLKTRIIALLSRHTAAAQTIASMTGTTLGCAKWQLSVMKRDGVITHTKAIPYTWSLTERGLSLWCELRQPNRSMAGEAA